jgi:digeranylgeranylglycerophospholipid reductase
LPRADSGRRGQDGETSTLLHERYDAVVVGAGPAGSRVARDLAAAGFHVALLEEHREVGLPGHCSGLVTPRTLEIAQVGDEIVLNTIRGAVLHLPSGRRYRLGGDRTHAYVIDRVALDRRLADQATRAGAQLLFSTAFLRFRLEGTPGPGRGAGEVVATVLREGVETEIRARLLIGADGALSMVARQIRGSRLERAVAGLGAVAGYDANPHADHVELFLDDHAAPGWFGWTIPVGNGVARVGTGSANGITPRESFARLRVRFPDSFGRAEVDSHTAGTIAIWEPTPMVANRVMLVGDAARQVKPTSGGGIHAAIHAAGLAAATAADALHSSNLSARSLQRYPDRWHAGLGREMQRGHDMRRVFMKLSPARLDHLVEALDRRPLHDAIDAVGDIDFPSQIVWAILRRDPVLALRLWTRPRFPGAWLARDTHAVPALAVAR